MQIFDQCCWSAGLDWLRLLCRDAWNPFPSNGNFWYFLRHCK